MKLVRCVCVASAVLKLDVRQPFLALACSATPLLTLSNLCRAVYRSPITSGRRGLFPSYHSHLFCLFRDNAENDS